jgi:hypothetical protein
MSDEGEGAGKPKKSGWLWPAGMVATGLAGMVLVAIRGCWHRKMSWPVQAQGAAYQVCLSCGAKRLFDEKRFRAYGPYRYDLEELIAWRKSREVGSESSVDVKRPAS